MDFEVNKKLKNYDDGAIYLQDRIEIVADEHNDIRSGYVFAKPWGRKPPLPHLGKE